MTQRKVLYIDPQKFLPKESSVEDELVGINTVVSGGSKGQVLKKDSNSSYDYSWQDSVELKTGEPTGYPNRTDSILSFDNSTRTFTISPRTSSFLIYLAGESYQFNQPQTVTIPDLTGEYYFYFDRLDQTLKFTNVPSSELFEKQGITSIIYWQSAQQKAIYFADERHGIVMDGSTHKHLHLSLGAQYRFGFDIHDITVDQTGELDSHAQFSITGGRIADEDIDIDVVHNQPQRLLGIAKLPVFYRIGAETNWFKTEADSFPLIQTGDVNGYAGTKPAYNRRVNNQWIISETSNNKFVLMHVIATNNINEPMIVVCGEEYETKSSARENARTELLNIKGLPFAEFVPIGTVIYQVNDAYENRANAKLVSTEDGFAFVDFRKQDLNIPFSTGGNSSLKVVRIPLSGFSRTVLPAEHTLTQYYSYRVVNSLGEEIVASVRENNLVFIIESIVNMEFLTLEIRGV